jgi:hypothetical protein
MESNASFPVYSKRNVHAASIAQEFWRSVYRSLALLCGGAGILDDIEEEERLLHATEIAFLSIDGRTTKQIHDDHMLSLPIVHVGGELALGEPQYQENLEQVNAEIDCVADGDCVLIGDVKCCVSGIAIVNDVVVGRLPRKTYTKVMTLGPQVIAELQMCLIADLGYLEDTQLHRTVVESRARKIMRDNSFRNNIIATHLDHIVNAYFECRAGKAIAGGSRHRVHNWVLRLLGFRPKSRTTNA